jgi:predicted chitinase
MDGKLNSFDNWLTKKVEEDAISSDLTNAGDTFADVLAKSTTVKEQPKGSNRGPEVDRYVKTVGLNPEKGYPWCMAFVYTMFNDFTSEMKIPNPLIKTAGVLNHWKKSDSDLKIGIEKIRSNPNLMKPGQIFIQDHGKGLGHTGIVVSVNAQARTFTTIEGNGIEKDTKEREGDKVVRNTRKMSQSNLVGVIDYFKGNRTEQFEQSISKQVAGTASKYAEDTTNGGYPEVSKSDTQSTSTNRTYYKIYDKENRRFLTAKYKGESFKVYNRNRVNVGEVFKKEDRIFMEDKDITETPVGQAFVKLFKYAEANKEIKTSSGKDFITITDGKVKHNYQGDKARNISLIESVAAKHGVTNPNAIIGILSVIGKESGFIPKSEKGYGGTSNSRIRSIFSATRNMSDEELNSIKSNDKLFFDLIYGGRYGNAQDEGYKYRGRGFNQITFKGTYEKYSKLLGKDLVNNPDLLNDPRIAAEAAVLFLLNRFKEKGYDPNTVSSVDDSINKFAGANAGWGKNPSNAIASANKIAPNFSIA